MALSQDTPRTYAHHPDVLTELPVKGSTRIYEGAAVGITSGYARGLAAGDEFAGFARFPANNSASSTDGAIRVSIVPQGILLGVSVTGATAVTHVHDTVYMSDDGTFTLSSTGNVAVGKIIRWISSGVADVFFQSLALRSL